MFVREMSQRERGVDATDCVWSLFEDRSAAKNNFDFYGYYSCLDLVRKNWKSTQSAELTPQFFFYCQTPRHLAVNLAIDVSNSRTVLAFSRDLDDSDGFTNHRCHHLFASSRQ